MPRHAPASTVAASQDARCLQRPCDLSWRRSACARPSRLAYQVTLTDADGANEVFELIGGGEGGVAHDPGCQQERPGNKDERGDKSRVAWGAPQLGASRVGGRVIRPRHAAPARSDIFRAPQFQTTRHNMPHATIEHRRSLRVAKSRSRPLFSYFAASSNLPAVSSLRTAPLAPASRRCAEKRTTLPLAHSLQQRGRDRSTLV
jgi:hypothetical protein